jgi:hypothetical protein
MCLWRAAKSLAVAESSGSTEMMLAAAAHLGCTSIATMAHCYSADKCLLCLPLQHDRYALAALCREQRSRVWPIKQHEGIGRAQFHRNTRLLYRKSWLLNNKLEAISPSLPLEQQLKAWRQCKSQQASFPQLGLAQAQSFVAAQQCKLSQRRALSR